MAETFKISKFFSFFPQIFKTAEELDLGCGVGGGKDTKDVFKVCTTLPSKPIHRRFGKIEGK